MQITTIGKDLGVRLVTFLFGLIVLPGIAWAAPSALEGIVKDASGRPIGGADIRIEAKNQNASNVVKSDGRGHYVYDGVSAGVTYRVTLLVNGAVKASINNVTAKSGESTTLNFDLKTSKAPQASAPAKKGKHMVWFPAQTGTNIGGRWVEVEDNTAAPGAERVQKVNSAALNRMQSNSGNRPTGGN